MQVQSCVGELTGEPEFLFKSTFDSYSLMKIKVLGQELPLVVSECLLKGNTGRVRVDYAIQSHKIAGKRTPTLFVLNLQETEECDSNKVVDLVGKVVTRPTFNLKKGTGKQFGSLVIKLGEDSPDYMIRCHGSASIARRLKATEIGTTISVKGYLKRHGKRLAVYVLEFKEV